MNRYAFMVMLLMSTYTVNASDIKPVINQSEFEGFEFTDKSKLEDVKISGYEYQSKDGRLIKFDNCVDSVAFGESNIVGNERLYFRLFLISCYALEKYLSAGSSSKTYFPAKFEDKLVKDFPAATMPLLYKAQARDRAGKTIKQYYSDLKINRELNGSIKLLSEEDEIYYTLVARGDFTNDGIEDLLVKSEWFARKAFGKHADLLILTKTGEGQPISIYWRLMKL